MAEIKEFKKEKPQTKTAAPTGGTKKAPDGQALKDLLAHPKAPLGSIVAFALFFLLALYLTVHFTNTGVIACCFLLVIQSLLAVCLDRLSYAGLLGIAAFEVIVGALSGNFLLSVLCLIPYFMALVVIHVCNLQGRIKTVS